MVDFAFVQAHSDIHQLGNLCGMSSVELEPVREYPVVLEADEYVVDKR
jgi:hypothetical protein